MNVSFDFDGTLHRDGRPLWPAMALLRRHHQLGHRVLIVTTRTESHERVDWRRVHEPDRVVISAFLPRHHLPVQSVVFTAHQPKVASLVRHGIDLHYDNDASEVALAARSDVRMVLLNGVTLDA